jgi:putative transcriptional regulator
MLTQNPLRRALLVLTLLLIPTAQGYATPFTERPRPAENAAAERSPAPTGHTPILRANRPERLPHFPIPEHPAQGVLLVASPGLRDPNFAQTVVLLADYSDEGAMGIIVNRPTALELEQILPEVEALQGREDLVYLGGPVNRQQILLLVRTRDPPSGAIRVFADLYLSATLEPLEMAVQPGEKFEGFRAYAGYAGWGPGQLENEIRRGDWKLQPGTTRRVMRTDVSRMWDELIQLGNELWVRTGATGRSNFPPVHQNLIRIKEALPDRWTNGRRQPQTQTNCGFPPVTQNGGMQCDIHS